MKTSAAYAPLSAAVAALRTRIAEADPAAVPLLVDVADAADEAIAAPRRHALSEARQRAWRAQAAVADAGLADAYPEAIVTADRVRDLWFALVD